MQVHRSRLSTIAFDGFIYAFGGENSFDTLALQSVERYDLQSNTWTMVAPMNVGRKGAATAVLNGHIYIMGGQNLRTVERYDPARNKWSNVASMIHRRSDGRAAVANGFIFILGGSATLATIERYDPQANTWTMVIVILLFLRSIWFNSMTIYLFSLFYFIFIVQMFFQLIVPRNSFGTIVHRGTVYIAGGYRFNGTMACEKIDLKTGIKQSIPQMLDNRSICHLFHTRRQ